MARLTGVFIAAAVVAASLPALAYVGPGPGLTMVGSLIGLVGSIFVALFMVLLYPTRLIYKKRKAKKAAKQAGSDTTPPNA